ncbi:3'3'-cGAMP-specific phosphodiesterase 2 [Azospirillaceae bacterium]
MTGHVSDNDLMFIDDNEEEKKESVSATSEFCRLPWKILIVDDDDEVHAVTRVVLGDVVFEGRSLRFLSAHSEAEARRVVSAHPDIAAILLDVVMETDDAGLRLVRYIRDELHNKAVRIILRTGQPGQAPERHIVVDYDINDYKAKSELTAQKLFTSTISALRSYQYIADLERSRQGLEKIIALSSVLFGRKHRQPFVESLLQNLSDLLGNVNSAFVCTQSDDSDSLRIAVGRGVYKAQEGQLVIESLPESARKNMVTALQERRTTFFDNSGVIFFSNSASESTLAYVEGGVAESAIDLKLLEIFCSKVEVGLDNIQLYDQLHRAHKGTIYALGKLAEYRDEMTGEHVRRVESLSRRIAKVMLSRGDFPNIVDDQFCEIIGLASILHDVGKIAIPDAILRKPGALDDQEVIIMRSHAEIGRRILADAAMLVGGATYLVLGAEIAGSHHEKFDGTGYPNGLAGDAIPLSGRIVALADVVDALAHKRPYKGPWSRREIEDFVRSQIGRHFDPRVVAAFFEAQDES